MFANLENFLNAKSVTDEPANDSQDASTANANDSWDLDFSNFGLPKGKFKVNDDDDDDGDDDDGMGGGATYVPGKGQKMAAKRLKKIGDTLAKGLVDTQKIEQRIEKQKAVKATRASKIKLPRKRNAPASCRQRRVYVDDMESDSESEIQTISHSTHSRSSRPYDPNTIVLDCDDEFIGGPAVNFTRNLSEAVSAEESKELKVSVRINGKIEQYQMHPFQKLSVLITQISDKKKVPVDHIALMFKDKTLSGFETPNSIGYIQGLVMKTLISETANKNKDAAASSTASNADKLEIKVQSEGRKRPFVTYISPTDQLITLAFACAEEFKCDVDKVAIEFDGEFINFKDTADNLALEGGEVMDFFMKK